MGRRPNGPGHSFCLHRRRHRRPRQHWPLDNARAVVQMAPPTRWIGRTAMIRRMAARGTAAWLPADPPSSGWVGLLPLPPTPDRRGGYCHPAARWSVAFYARYEYAGGASLSTRGTNTQVRVCPHPPLPARTRNPPVPTHVSHTCPGPSAALGPWSDARSLPRSPSCSSA